MPTSDGRLYSFKYVNGHPRNTAAGLAHGDGLRRAVGCGDGISHPAVRDDVRHGAAHRRDVGAWPPRHMARAGIAASWRSSAMARRANSRRSHSTTCSASANCACSIPTREATAKLKLNLESLRPARSHVRSCASIAEARARRRHRHDGDGRQAQRAHLDPGHDRAGHALECGGRRLPRQDGAARGHLATARCAHRGRVRAAGPHRGRDPAARRRRARHRARRRRLGQAARHGSRAAEVSIFDSVGFALNDFSSLRYSASARAASPAAGVSSISSRGSMIRRICSASSSSARSRVAGAAREGIPA